MSFYYQIYLNTPPSPNELYEIESDLICTNDQLTFISNNFGPTHAKYIYSSASRSWIRNVLQNIQASVKEMKPQLRNRILNNAIDIFNPPGKSRSRIMWPSNAIPDKNYKITSKDHVDQIFYLDLMSNQFKLNETSQKYILSTALQNDQLDTLTALIYPVIKISNCLYYVDRYFELFNSNNAYKKMLHKIFNIMIEDNKEMELNIITTNGGVDRPRISDINIFISKFKSEFSTYFNGRLTVKLFIYTEDCMDLHDRFFFGKHIGGWGCGRGLRPSQCNTQALCFFTH